MKLNSILFITLISVIVLTSLILGAFVFGMFSKTLENNLKTNTLSQINASLDLITNYMFERNNDMLILTNAEHPIMSSNNMKNKLNLLHNFEQSSKNYISFSIYDKDGKKILDTRNVGINNTVSREEFFNTAMSGTIYRDSNPTYSPEFNQHMIRFSGPVYDQDKNIVGVLVANTSILPISKVINQNFPKSLVDIISKEGIIIFSNHDRASLFTQIDYALQKNQYEYDQFFIFTDVQKAYLDYPSSQWTMSVKIQKDEFFNERAKQQLVFFLISSMIVIGMIILSLVISSILSRPILNLKNAIIQIQNGNYVEIKKEGTDETKELASAFNVMSKSIKIYNKNLEDLNTIVNTATAVSITDVNGKIKYVNDKFCETSKYSRSELIGNNHRILKSGFYPDEFYKNMWDTITRGEIWSGEIKNINKNSEYYWIKTVIMPFKDDSGNIYQFMSIRTDITEQKRIQEQLNKAILNIKNNEFIIKEQLDAIKKMDKQKDEFSSMVSHELKSPLLPILGYCELLGNPESNKNLTKDQKEAILEITNSAEQLNKITHDVLDAQKLEMNRLSLNFTSFDVHILLDDMLKSHAPITSEKNIILEIKDDLHYMINSDRVRLRQVFDNLIRNAIDFVPRDAGWIHIGAIDKNDHIVFYVKDNGIGILQEKQKELFRKFYQIDASYTRSHGGTGLGLVICKSLIELMGGTIWVESTPGNGTTFYFMLSKDQMKS